MYQTAESLYKEIAKDKSLFPNVPETSIKILNAMEDPNCNNDRVAKIIQLDAGLSAFIVKSASSLRFHTRIPPKDLTSAIRRMGLRESYHLSLAFLSRAAFHTSDKQLKRYLTEAYSLSTQTAVIAFFLAQQQKCFEPGQAMLGGLMQDIGVPAILAAMSKHPELLQDSERRDALVDLLASRVGLMILKIWGFDPEIISVVRNRHQWFRDDHENPDLADLVLIARLHALIGKPAFRQCPPIDSLPAFKKLQLGELGPDSALMLLKESREEIRSIGQLLAA